MVHFSLSSHIDRNDQQVPRDNDGWETTLRVVASLSSMASGWAVHGLGVLGYRWSVTPKPIPGQWSPSAAIRAFRDLQTQSSTHPALRYGTFSAAGLWAGAVKAISHMFLQEYIFVPLLHLATTDEEQDETFEPYDPIAPVVHGDMYQRGGWKGPMCAMLSAAGAILVSLPFLKAKFRLRTQAPRADGSYKYTGLFQSISVMWREQRWGLITNNLGAFISFGILYDVVGFLTDRYKLSTLMMTTIKTREGMLHNIKHALALALDDVIEAAIIVLFTMPVNVVLRRLEAQAGGVAPFSAEGVVYAGVVDCVRQVFVNEGLGGFYKGAIPELLERLLPRVFVDAAVDLSLNSFFGVPPTFDNDEASN
jgi:hypothetical protein